MSDTLREQIEQLVGQMRATTRHSTRIPSEWVVAWAAKLSALVLVGHGKGEPIDIVAMRANLHATFNGGHETPETIRAFHHGMDTVCNVLDAKQNGQGTNGIFPDTDADLQAWAEWNEKQPPAVKGAAVVPPPSPAVQDWMPKRTAQELAAALRERAARMTGERWELTANVAMMREAADLLAPPSPEEETP